MREDRLCDVQLYMVELADDTLENNPIINIQNLDLTVLRRRTCETHGRHNLFIATELSDADDVNTPSQIEVWQDKPLSHEIDFDFHQEIRKICNSQLEVYPSVNILLVSAQLNESLNSESKRSINRDPYLYTLLLLLIDKPQSHLSPTLIGGEWQYKNLELIFAIELILKNLGFRVWSEWYEDDLDKRIKIAHQLVGILSNSTIAEVQFSRLELTEQFKHTLQLENSYLSNQTRIVRRIFREISNKFMDGN